MRTPWSPIIVAASLFIGWIVWVTQSIDKIGTNQEWVMHTIGEIKSDIAGLKGILWQHLQSSPKGKDNAGLGG